MVSIYFSTPSSSRLIVERYRFQYIYSISRTNVEIETKSRVIYYKIGSKHGTCLNFASRSSKLVDKGRERKGTKLSKYVPRQASEKYTDF